LLGAVAAPLAELDNPLVIGATSLLFGTGAWYFSKRREQADCINC
jgi:hypothetical protein